MLSGKNILVTGASSGIGRQIAIDVASNNGFAILTGRDDARLFEVSELIRKSKQTKALFFSADLTMEEDIVRLTDYLPPLSGVVINAGIIDYTPVKYLTKEKVENILLINFVSNVLLIKRLLELRKIQSSASIVFISSISTRLGIPGTSMYAASKSALSAFAKILAIELSTKRVRVNVVSPGLIATDLTEKISAVKSSQTDDVKSYPLGWGTVNNVSDQVIHLLSDKSEWMTGTDILIDGGFTLR